MLLHRSSILFCKQANLDTPLATKHSKAKPICANASADPAGCGQLLLDDSQLLTNPDVILDNSTGAKPSLRFAPLCLDELNSSPVDILI